MTDALPAVEAWIRLAGLGIGAAVVLIVPLTGFMKEYWAYRARIRESDRLRSDTGRNLPGASIGSFLETTDLVAAAADLTAAARDLATALREGRPAGRPSPGEGSSSGARPRDEARQ